MVFRVGHRFSQLNCAKSVFFNGFNTAQLPNSSYSNIQPLIQNPPQSCNYAQDVTVRMAPKPNNKNISKAMKAYLERAQEHDEFMRIQTQEYQMGKRHLANMMGEDPETFTQEDVDRSIEYLFPSGLYDKKARPIMKPPEEIFPARKAAEFDETGRPFHSMFYTGKANFFKLLYDVAEQINKMNKYEDQMIRQHKTADPALKPNLSGSQWLTKEELETILMEEIIDLEYNNFVNAFNRLVEMPYSYQVNDFVMKYRKPLLAQKNTSEILKPKYDENGRQYVTVYECLRKTARGDVTIRSPGNGKITINGKDITYFEGTQPREQLLFPLIFTGLVENVDVEANVEGGGPSGQAGAIRWGIAMGLRSFVDPEMVDKMRLAGLLQRDYRTKERKKPGQEGARRKYTWKKR